MRRRAIVRVRRHIQIGQTIRHGPHAALIYYKDKPLIDEQVPLVLDGLQLKLGALQLRPDGECHQDLHARVHQQVEDFATRLQPVVAASSTAAATTPCRLVYAVVVCLHLVV